jgi:CrcB protein
LATLLVNVSGSFLIGLLAGSDAARSWLVDDVRVFLLVGILGGFTTFSSFSYDTLYLWRESGAPRAALNVALNVTLCLFAVWLGDAANRG